MQQNTLYKIWSWNMTRHEHEKLIYPQRTRFPLNTINFSFLHFIAYLHSHVTPRQYHTICTIGRMYQCKRTRASLANAHSPDERTTHWQILTRAKCWHIWCAPMYNDTSCQDANTYTLRNVHISCQLDTWLDLIPVSDWDQMEITQIEITNN